MNNRRDQSLEALNRAFSWKYHSLAAYILEAQPYTRPDQLTLVQAVQSVAEEDLRQANELASAIDKLEGIPDPRAFSPKVGEYNYLSIQYLLNELIKELEKQAAQFERDGRGDLKPVARDRLRKLSEITRIQIEQLRAKIPASQLKDEAAE